MGFLGVRSQNGKNRTLAENKCSGSDAGNCLSLISTISHTKSRKGSERACLSSNSLPARLLATQFQRANNTSSGNAESSQTISPLWVLADKRQILFSVTQA